MLRAGANRGNEGGPLRESAVQRVDCENLIDSGRKRFLIDSYLSGRRLSTAVGRCGWVGYQVGSNLGGYLLRTYWKDDE